MPTHTRRVWRALLALVMVVALSACTPEQVIRAVWHDDGPTAQQQAVDVAWCESTLRPDARSGPNLGLFQLNWGDHGWRWPGGDPYDPLVNATVAHGLWRDEGWRPWSCPP